MLERLEIERNCSGSFFKGVPVRMSNTGFDDTIEVLFGPVPRKH